MFYYHDHFARQGEKKKEIMMFFCFCIIYSCLVGNYYFMSRRFKICCYL